MANISENHTHTEMRESMSTTELEIGASTARPKTLSTSWLVQRAVLGLLILVTGTVGSVWLYDASLKANALGNALGEVPAKIVTSAK
jgi:hypothetical protein